ncbi:MAG TPA: nuclear transport factor 2 family protein [Candidatus Kryptonia bacterium]|nr:nuclear transport factor 2 family protein [Candidatus Kryptonia bacterium]
MSIGRDAIATLIFSYAEMLDAGDFAGVAQLFAHATYRTEGRPPHRGTDEVLAVLKQMVAVYGGIPRTKHVTTNTMIEIDEARGSATARSYFTVFQAVESFPLQAVIAGRYHDCFVCVEGVWRFSDRLIFVDLVGDLSHHLQGTIGQPRTKPISRE